MAWNRNMGVFIFFATLWLVKVSAIHVYSHTNNDCDRLDNCEYCELAIENQNSENVIPLPCIIEIPHMVYTVLYPNYNPYVSFVSKSLATKNTCRPPPEMA